MACAERGEVALDLLGLPARAAVLEPDGDLARVEAEVARDPGLALRVQLVVHLEAPLQRSHLIRRQTPLLLPEAAAGTCELLIVVLLVVRPGLHVIALSCGGAIAVHSVPLHVPATVFCKKER